ncbi:MAG: hypothetical protein AAF513_11440 [Pseudomonadota bacterium]
MTKNEWNASMWLRWLLLCCLFWSPAARAYESRIHQELTFIAARQFNDCVLALAEVPRLSALDTRFLAKANVAQAEGNFFVRMFRWNYYNPDAQQNRSTLGVIETRFHSHFNNVLKNLVQADTRTARLRQLGRVINYVQDVTSPPHVVPVYTGRWWRLSLADRFNQYRIDADRVEMALQDSCDYMLDTVLVDEEQVVSPYAQILIDTAGETITSVQGQIFGFPVTWEAYWRFADDVGDFGEYGPAGNSFGERTEFRCGDRERCLLLKNDPLYRDFAFDRHVAAVLATMKVLYVLQLEGDETGPDSQAQGRPSQAARGRTRAE